MAAIAPNSTIRLLHNCPLDDSYQHTIYFASKGAQTSYFESITKSGCTFTDQSYQRVKRGWIRIQKCADDIYDCNYLMFKNTSFGNKWFYAFIRQIEYINNVVSEVEFEIDVMQTWMFDYTLEECFVEREHSATDNIGDNLNPEPLDVGEYIFNSYAPVANMVNYGVILAIVDVTGDTGETGTATSGNVFDRVYSGAELWAYNSTDVISINAKIEEYTQKPDSIMSIYTVPILFFDSIPNGGKKLVSNSVALTHNYHAPACNKTRHLDGYLPRNAKLYTYPYNFYHVDNCAGESLTLRYEYFDDLQPSVEIYGCITQPVTAVLRPTAYKNIGGSNTDTATLNTESLTISNYPLCSWNVDSYKAWVAQNSVPLAVNTITSVAQGVASGGLIGGLSSALGSVANVASQTYTASIAADICKGSLSTGSPNISTGRQQFYGGRCSVSAPIAKTIDDFFDMFGYSTRRLKTPNTHSRPHWNYVKTIGCVITGSVPAVDSKDICKIYDNGITFWKNASEVGNYSLDNSPS